MLWGVSTSQKYTTHTNYCGKELGLIITPLSWGCKRRNSMKSTSLCNIFFTEHLCLDIERHIKLISLYIIPFVIWIVSKRYYSYHHLRGDVTLQLVWNMLSLSTYWTNLLEILTNRSWVCDKHNYSFHLSRCLLMNRERVLRWEFTLFILAFTHEGD